MASAHDFTFTTIDNKPLDMKAYAGKPVLVVNVASFCGFTPQYTDLQKLHETYGPKGLVVLGVPSNDFGAQEPRTEPEIAKFCETMYGVTFPLTAKQKVVGMPMRSISGLPRRRARAPRPNGISRVPDRRGRQPGGACRAACGPAASSLSRRSKPLSAKIMRRAVCARPQTPHGTSPS
jgi:hypothetical protein